jgi:hypothetical protein
MSARVRLRNQRKLMQIADEGTRNVRAPEARVAVEVIESEVLIESKSSLSAILLRTSSDWVEGSA